MRNLFSFLFALFCIGVNAGNYPEILKTGRVWNCKIIERVSRAELGTATVSVDPDTIIVGYMDWIPMRHLSITFNFYEESGWSIQHRGSSDYFYYKSEDGMSRTFYRNKHDNGFLYYERDGVIYRYTLEDNKFDEVINFHLRKGDLSCTTEQCIFDEDSVEVRGTKYRRLILCPPDEDKCWIEGVGSLRDDYFINTVHFLNFCDEPILRFDSMYDNGELVCTFDDFKVPITTGIEKVRQTRANDNQIYDLSGRKLDTPHKKGIYIKNGKKYIER